MTLSLSKTWWTFPPHVVWKKISPVWVFRKIASEQTLKMDESWIQEVTMKSKAEECIHLFIHQIFIECWLCANKKHKILLPHGTCVFSEEKGNERNVEITQSTRRWLGVPGGRVVKNLPANAGDEVSTPGLGNFPGVGNGNPFQYSFWEKSHGQRSLMGYTPWGRYWVGHCWAIEQACRRW